MGARRFCNIGRILASVGIVFVLLVVFQGSGSAGANSGTYGWELGAQFDGETAGFQGNDSGVDVVCPDGYLVAGGGIDWGWNGLLRTISGIALACRKVNELGANPDWMQSFYDWDAATTTAT